MKQKGYCLYDLKCGKVIHSRYVTTMPGLQKNTLANKYVELQLEDELHREEHITPSHGDAAPNED